MAKEVLSVIYATTSSKLDDLEEKFGQLIILDTNDNKAIYYDGDNGRIQFTGIIVILKTEAIREAMDIIPYGFYFCQDSAVLWNYSSNGWVQITTPPESQIYFGEYEDFPKVGDANRLYISGTDMYRYIDGNYENINKIVEWIEI